MGAATVQIRAGTGSSVSWANAESAAVKHNRADSISDTTTPIPVPTSTGTNYSWIKNFSLYVTATGTTTMSNRTIKQATSPATGLAYHWKAVAVASYAQAASGNMPSASGSNGATPSGYTAMTGTAAQYDGASVATSSTGPNGSMAVVVLGVSGNYAGDPGTAISLPDLNFGYDEA